MKYTIKGYEEKEVEIEVEADSYKSAFIAATKKQIKVTSINDEPIFNRSEAAWADEDDFFFHTIETIKDKHEEELELLKEVFKRNKGIEYFIVTFSGSSDEGNVDGYSVYPEAFHSVTEEHVACYQVFELLEIISDKFMNDVPVDWVNGDGGCGELQMSFDTKGQFKIKIHCQSWEQTEGATFNKKVTFK